MTKDAKDEKILAALLTNNSTRAAATACSISETQIYERLRDPAFKKKYDTARLQLLEEATASLQKNLSGAVDKIADIAADKTNPPQVRLNACEALIRSSLKMTEQVEILRRLEALEETIKK